jgi:hypothetical protein
MCRKKRDTLRPRSFAAQKALAQDDKWVGDLECRNGFGAVEVKAGEIKENA